jgi:hypothetical protein
MKSGTSSAIAVIAAIGLLIATVSTALGQCAQSGRTRTETPVYDSKPVFSTGQGWRMGSVVTTLPPNTPVMICEITEVGVLFDKKSWALIQFDGQRTGWAFFGHIDLTSSGMVPTAPTGLVSAAYAAAELPEPGNGLPSSGLFLLYLLMFFFVLSGMFGKVVFDEINNSQAFSLRNCLGVRNWLKAVIVAPIVFLTFLNTADVSATSGELGLLIMACLAFQNGFFWQTVLPSRGSLRPNETVRVATP